MKGILEFLKKRRGTGKSIDFVALDLETANPDFSSICQIGIVRFYQGHALDRWETLVNPETTFARANKGVHGIRAQDVKDAPTYLQVFGDVKRLLQGQVVVHYTFFDRKAMNAAHKRYGLPPLQCSWLDVSSVVRGTWPQFARRGYGLSDMTKFLGIELDQHHRAVVDARAAGEVFVRAMAESKTPLGDWVKLYESQAEPGSSGRGRRSYPSPVTREGNADGPLAGEVLVFTGELSMSRVQAADIAANAGCEVKSNVTKKTTILVVGDQDLSLLAGHRKSSKQRKAEAYIEQGQAIRVIGESDFLALVAFEG